MIERNDILTAELCLSLAAKHGAQSCRVTLSKSKSDNFATLNGEIDSVSRSSDRSVTLALFVDGRYACFSTNQLGESALDEFIRQAVHLTSSLAADNCRSLPDPERCCKSAVTGDELELCDNNYQNISEKDKRNEALEATIFGKVQSVKEDLHPLETAISGKVTESTPVTSAVGTDTTDGYKIISEEGEYSDSLSETLLMDSAGLRCVRSETSFDYYAEVSIMDGEGRKYSAYCWDSATRKSGLNPKSVGLKALDKAVRSIGSKAAPGGNYTMIAGNEISGRLLTPLLNALGGYALQQGDSFLADSLDKSIFGESLTIIDNPHIKGEGGSRMFDSEGVATVKAPVIEKGVVKKYFLNSYTAAKMGLEPTIEECSRAEVLPYGEGMDDSEAMMKAYGEGILVTGFVGGNCNSTTGDFSYGVEGFLFHDGQIVHPVSGMLITGNMIELWKNLLAAGKDARRCAIKLVPSLAFANVSFN